MFFSFFVGNGLFSTIVQSVRVGQSKFLIKLDTINIENESITKWLDIWRRINEMLLISSSQHLWQRSF